ncbi:hypothetical protein SEA_RUTHY_68 [Gordonia phage Ruthy]|uniref:Uncharacterized protein n=1 Tax=Gordonia phage Ruthy TaxID=2250323 RepID=A0A345L5H9_9CAUD|nr:hypothetical protein HOT73_gp68 [Gordonia phage Ruthy]AXH50531.1 hypothetical protein SEA_RUTHY_68 [Gordonia phage Ruthy]
MSNEDDRPDYFQLEGKGLRDNGADDPVISRESFQLHHYAIVNSVRDGHPGYVSEDYLNAISTETTTSTVELELAGLWVREGAGYRIHDPLVDEAVRFDKRMDDGAAECAARGRHLLSDDGTFCETCLKPFEQ